MRQRLLQSALLLAALAACASPLAAQRRYGTDRVVKDRRYTEAAKAYGDTLKRAGEEDSATRARALFGRSYAVQQVLATDSAAPRPAEAVLSDYLEARALDSARYYAAASHNAGTLLRQEGRHREAVGYYLDAARVASPSRPVSLYSAAREYEALERPDSAELFYRAALASHPGYTEARLALLRLYARPDATDSLLAVAQRWTEPDAAAPVNDAILQVLTAPEGSVQRPTAEPLLTVLARNLAAADMDPETFGRVYRERVEHIATVLPWLARPVLALADCYRPRTGGERYDEPAGAKWWSDPFIARATRAQTWSTTLRQVGDGYYRAGAEATAASYYEAALDYPDSPGPPPSADLGALLPLGVIYLHRSSSGASPETLEALDRYINFMFMGKGERYGRDDIRQVRAFHMALGELFAQRGEWTGKGPRNVIFQLERMRWATKRLRQEGEPDAFDPPELLERLATAYRKSGQADKAKAVAGEARDAYQRLGRAGDAARMDSLAGPPAPY